MERDWRGVFESTYASAASPLEERVWRAVFGAEYPEGVDPYSFVTRSELARFVQELRVGKGHSLVDLGCGRGGAGLWVARRDGRTPRRDRHRGERCHGGSGTGCSNGA